MLTLGYKASAEQFGSRELLEFSVLAQEVGFDAVVVSDHFQPWKHTGGHAPYAFAWLGAVGERAETVQLGTSVVAPTFRYNPAIVAQAMATLASLFPGRVFLGVGTGESMNEVPATGMEWPGFKERFGRLREAIELIQRLWTEERVSYQGQYYTTVNATIYERPPEHIPLLVAASGPTAAKLAGRVSDGLIVTSGKGMELYRDNLLPAFVEAAQKAGRDPNALTRMIEVKVSYDHDRKRAMEDTRNWAALALSSEEKTGVEDPVEMERLASQLATERAATRWIVSDNPEDQIARIQPYIDLGFNYLVFHSPTEDQERFLRLYGAEILPRLRELAA
ncbi:MAG TPA: glucose-6-phosphate dehydrogenase (coenzyme-F420), partial [Thermomicrobiaceae bacterium]|nr:glucose-6-phosphate dehydrogenase (coenzyme-F420) [Thermomicrobiaceae bacterium]